MKKVLILCLLLLAPVFADQVFVGKFVEIQVGDYAHLNVVDGKGNERSFWVSGDSSFEPFLEQPEKYRGKQVKVHWHKVKRNIPEAGGEMEIEEATSIELAK